MPDASQPRQKRFYRIGEVADLVGVPPHVLRYWENEFKALKPRKGSGGQRLYQPGDIELLERIRTLLHEQKFTVEGARKALEGGPATMPAGAQLDQWLFELDAIRDLLD